MVSGQYLPPDDAFTEAASAYGDSPTFYQGYIPWSTDTATGYSVTTNIGNFHDGYNLQAGGTTVATRGLTTAAGLDFIGANKNLVSGLWRPYYDTDSTTEAWFTLHVATGTADQDSLVACGVCARATGGAITSGGTHLEYVTGGDSYWFLLATGASGPRFFLLRVNAGVTTLIGSAYDITHAALRPQYGFGMRMHVRNSGDITCTLVQTFGLTGGASTTTVFNLTDGTPLTAAGRCGFGTNSPNTQGSGTISLPLCSYFRVSDDTNGLQVHDRFQRAVSTHAAARGPDAAGVSGRDIRTGWIGDVYSTGATQLLTRDSGSDRAEHDATALGGWYVSTRPPTSIATQSRSGVFQFNATGTGDQRAGLFVRGTFSSTAGMDFVVGSGWKHYAFFVEHDRSGVTRTAYLRSYNGLTDQDLLASADVTGTVALGVDFTLSMAIVNEGGTDEFAGIPALTCKINGTTVSWVLGSESGVSLDSTNVVRDSRSNRILIGECEGVLLTSEAGLASPVYFDTWTEGSLPGPPSIDENSQSSIAVSGEADGATGTFTFDVLYPVPVLRTDDRRVFRYDSGHIYRHLAQGIERRVWSAGLRRPTADRAALRAFWDSHNGTEIPFSWTEPVTGEAVTVCFADDELGDTLQAPGVWDGNVALLELFP